MNFLPGEAVENRDCETIGFRAEWVQLQDSGEVRGMVVRMRVEGTRDGSPFGLVTLSTDFGDVSVRGPANCEVGMEYGLHVQRYVAFQGEHKVDEVERV